MYIHTVINMYTHTHIVKLLPQLIYPQSRVVIIFLCDVNIRLYSLGNFKCTLLLTILITFYIKTPELIHLITETLHSLTKILPFFIPPVSGNHIILFQKSLTF